MTGGTRLVMLDRDGVLNRDLARSVRAPEALEMLPGAAAAVARLNGAGWRTALVTNQAVVGRGEVDPATFAAIQDRLVAALAAAGARLDGIYVCTDADDGSPRRKPAPGMLREALADFGADPAETPMIGDALRDLQAAAAAGCRRVLVRTGKGRHTERRLREPALARLLPVAVHDDLSAAVDALLRDAEPACAPA